MEWFMTQYLFLSRLILFCMAWIVAATAVRAQENEIEKSRVYGKMFVAPLKLEMFPPVCVVEKIAGPDVKSGFAAMRDPNRPSIVLFCKDILPEAKPLIAALNRTAQANQLPLFLTVTLEKGIARGEPGEFDPALYLQAEETKEVINQLRGRLESMEADQVTSGIAVNRFWRDAIGYPAEKDLLLAYVRGKVLHIEQLSSGSLSEAEVAAIVERVEQSHQKSKPVAP
jgi:hypothetical protein